MGVLALNGLSRLLAYEGEEGGEHAAGAAEVAQHAPGWFLDHAWLIPLIPAIAFWVIILFGKRLRWKGSEVGLASMVASLVLSIGATYQWIQYTGHGAPPIIKQWVWWQSGGVEIGIGQHIDGLAIMALLLVSFISTLVQMYSLDYVRGDRRYTHFFASLSLFSAGMLCMVLAPNMIQLILGWEIMGLCSFLLIGHWWEDEANSRAALKAFFTVRVGDMGLLVGTGALFGLLHTFNIGEINDTIAAGGGFSKTGLTLAAVALFIACIGKSGQFPLHTWLPDAMAGPTPVSSLLHSSTMVVAGVFLVARIYPVFHSGLDINIAGQHFNLIAVIGGITVLIAAALAFVQNDIKKVLAYSTVSQLGYMMMGLGVGAWTAAVFHIFTHAFFKCCLFLCAGSVSHTGSHHSFDMRKDMGGLFRKMPVTAWTWIVSTAALCGVPFFSGFFSKDEIIDSAHANHYTVFWIVGLVGAFMTTAYMTRATWLTFFGEPRGAARHFVMGEHDAHDHDDAHDDAHVAAHNSHDSHDTHDRHDTHADAHDTHDSHAVAGHSRPLPFAPHDSGWLITVPLIILAFLALVSGYLNAPAFHIEKFHHWVTPEFINEMVPHAPVFKWVNALPSIVLVALGFVVSLYLTKAVFGRASNAWKGLTQRNPVLGAGHRFLVNKYYLDDLYEKGIVHAVAHPIAQAGYWVNQNVIDRIVNLVGIGGKLSGRWVYRNVDERVVDGAVNGSGMAAEGMGSALRPTQSGKVNQYGALLFSAAGVAALVLLVVNR